MTITELQQWVDNDWKQHSSHQPSVKQQLLYIMEELGEVAEAIRKQDGKKPRKELESDLGSEIADLLVTIVTLANHFDIDITSEIEKFQARMTERHAAGH